MEGGLKIQDRRACMKEVEYKDDRGRLFKVLIPDGDPIERARHGIVVGPPELDDLGLPESVMVELHNQLYYRGLFTFVEVNKRRMDVIGALQAALSVNVNKIIEIYR